MADDKRNSAFRDCGNWDITLEALKKLRAWELQRQREITASPWQATKELYYQTSAIFIDVIREKTKQPHLLHVCLDEINSSAYHQYHSTDQLERTLINELRQHRDIDHWGWIKFIPHHIRYHMGDRVCHRTAGRYHAHEDFHNEIFKNRTWENDILHMTKKENC